MVNLLDNALRHATGKASSIRLITQPNGRGPGAGCRSGATACRWSPACTNTCSSPSSLPKAAPADWASTYAASCVSATRPRSATSAAAWTSAKATSSTCSCPSNAAELPVQQSLSYPWATRCPDSPGLPATHRRARPLCQRSDTDGRQATPFSHRDTSTHAFSRFRRHPGRRRRTRPSHPVRTHPAARGLPGGKRRRPERSARLAQAHAVSTCVITDMRLPDGLGLELLREITEASSGASAASSSPPMARPKTLSKHSNPAPLTT